MAVRYLLIAVMAVCPVPALSQTTASQADQLQIASLSNSIKPASNIPALPRLRRYFTYRPRLIFEGEFGSAAALGYELPSTAFGPSIEVPLGNSWEIQTLALYSPDRKAITHDGQSLKLEGLGIRFLNAKIGVVGGIERDWLWTSQFDKRSLEPSAGIVLRNDSFGRLYLTSLFPTGCVWATSSNPCTIQSNRLQGGEFRQEARLDSHFRLGFRGGVYRFCDQANPKEPQTGRNCHFGVTAYMNLGFELHLGQPSRFKRRAASQDDNF